MAAVINDDGTSVIYLDPLREKLVILLTKFVHIFTFFDNSMLSRTLSAIYTTVSFDIIIFKSASVQFVPLLSYKTSSSSPFFLAICRMAYIQYYLIFANKVVDILLNA